jgi:hypothetical protein
MSELLRRGFIAAMAPVGVPNADIVVTDIEGLRLCSIQVKTRRDIGSDGGWHMKAKHESISSDRVFYCFVDFGKHLESAPVVHVLPSAVVAKVLTEAHRKWLSIPGKRGQPHKDSVMRRLVPDYSGVFGADDSRFCKGWLNPYLNAWHLLGLATTEPEQSAKVL